MKPIFNRVILKISGSFWLEPKGSGIDTETINKISY